MMVFIYNFIGKKEKGKLLNNLTHGIVADPVRYKKFHFKCPSNCPKIYNTESAYAVSFMKYSVDVLGSLLNIQIQRKLNHLLKTVSNEGYLNVSLLFLAIAHAQMKTKDGKADTLLTWVDSYNNQSFSAMTIIFSIYHELL